MIGRWLRTAGSLFGYFCVATLLAEGMILAYLWSTWQLNREKVVQMLAIAQGIDLLAAQREAQSGLEQIPPEQLSDQDLIQRRAAIFRDLELREQALNNAVAQLRLDQQQLAEAQRASKQLIDDFEARLLALQQGAETGGRETVARILETLKPKQAKEQILEMLQKDEIDEVVILLNSMTESKRAKILAEFKTAEENAKVSEVLRRIRQGEPASSTAQATLGQLPSENSTGS